MTGSATTLRFGREMMTIFENILRVDMGRRIDDLTSDIIDIAIDLRGKLGAEAASFYLDENLIDVDVSNRVLSGNHDFLRATETDIPPPAEIDLVKSAAYLLN